MHQDKDWQLTVHISEQDRYTEAEAKLSTPNGTLTGRGVARRNPRDADVPSIGDELAVSRALSELSHGLLDAAAREISQIEHRKVRLTH
ncbi:MULTISPECIES: DUF1876 domain-containing protein [Thermomonospora]|uniref:DUF1876 domain-containing protein n=1 Tax=Thermomonospora curvata (strain ATCC 19995 / DSM 43183 / JCM 3096 / KCTC 9072 / NBRC 15933 / NCIMB 10081 / Henssen B9) TaxID=471852 RepID=D1A730_THECD|nr:MULTISPECIES: DUF1876 domain-containing protein [Thermomonospora]ACY98434.1 Domain of unknown function DUF1876 [Thermomonospora curvata DSM 43183]PKK13584.1 MAG: DUF1876 domain-containing protein [Thermomonospora sp. CIF 1]